MSRFWNNIPNNCSCFFWKKGGRDGCLVKNNCWQVDWITTIQVLIMDGIIRYLTTQLFDFCRGILLKYNFPLLYQDKNTLLSRS